MASATRTLRRASARLSAALALLSVAACAAAPQRTTTAPAAVETPRSEFQRRLDALGVPLELPPRGKAIVVNVPAYELIAFEDAEPELRSRIIAGTPWNPTPLIETYTTAVRFRPTWRPTPAMVRSGEYEDRIWPPGRRNPLGLAAIRLEPGLLVYLHDTNRRDLFERETRALSHGCIRVQRWDALAAWLLDAEIEEVRRLAEGGRTFDAPTPRVPVRIGYFTLFPDDAGRPVRHPDVYGLRAEAGAEDPAEVAAAGPPRCAPPAEADPAVAAAPPRAEASG